ncbi:MAG: thioredoxin family protein [Planctomycetaceae bacterium]|nr:thioredoxin family protein [Planctomycetaceae bacterium]
MTTLLCATVVQAALLLSGADAAASETYADAHRAAVATGKPIVVLVSTTWCAPCQTMKRHTLPRVRANGILKRVAFAVVDPDEDSELAEQLTGGGPVPQMVMYHKTSQGWVRQKLIGGQTEEAVEQFINEGLASDEAEKKAEAAKTSKRAAADRATAHRSDPASEKKAVRKG